MNRTGKAVSQPRFKRKLVVSAVASVLATGVAPLSWADDIANEVADDATVVDVVGIRGSLQSSRDRKREEQGIVDTINAEDIGKFPDSNLAESLQRITGLSINRRNGEGNQVTARGFGPDYNLTTLNGRLMPATSLNQNGGGVSQGRAFDMDNLASESVRALSVYKTSRADIASGGMGATINIETLRPLQNPGLHASLGGKLLHDTSNEVGDDYTPEVSGLFSWTNDQNNFGVSVTGSYQQRDSGASGAYVNGWNYAEFDGNINQQPTDPGSGAPINIFNPPADGSLYGMPTDLRYTHSDRERTRTNAQLTLQWKPKDNLTGTLDYTYAKQELYENRSELSIWMDSYKSDLAFDNGTAQTPVLYWEERVGRGLNPRDVGLALQQQNQVNELNSLGFNLKWEVNEALTLALDAHDSEASSLPDAGFGNWINIGLGANVSGAQGVNWTSNGIPIIMIGLDDSLLNDNGVLDVSEVGSAVRQINNDRSYADYQQIRLDGKFEFENFHSIDFGVESRTMEHRLKQSFYQELLEGGWGVANPGDVPAEFLDPINYGSLFDGYSMTPGGTAAGFFSLVSGGSARPLLMGYTGDAAQIGEYLSAAVGLPWDVNPVDNLNRTIKEEVWAVYAQYRFNGDWGKYPVRAAFGVRYENTDVTSTDQANIPTEVIWESNNDYQVPAGDTAVMYTQTASYDHVLPNLDIDVGLTDDIKARFSYSKTIARARFDSMGAAATGLGGPTFPTILPGSILGGAQSGNPGILPLESKNLDLSVEWYFGDASYASLGYFRKDVKNFIGTEAVNQTLYDLRDPTNGPRVQQAIADLEALDIPVNDTSLFTMVAANILGVAYDAHTPEEFETLVDVVGEPGDELMVFRVSRPANNEDAVIDGWEMAFQQFFGDTGFGVLLNYTDVAGDVSYDNGAPSDVSQFALTGLSDTANVSLIYENYGVSARLAYNWREEFLVGIENGGLRPRYIEDYEQFDLNVSYAVTDDLSISFEGINLTGEDERQHARTSAQFLRLEILEPRYAFGVRYNF
ncbi:TonB-dependent receptor [Permianibacter sp. IMCC34836]|uniref:TonB-dependent receptor n=1 Tax=Permianibacter fluminis TaxID=2738515 RepID=UPI0015526ACB|nr:TonB-dependent receptor [Permianibacter fluminis]NQD36430.1 TonB-dependent receptor [Permianibacter fluminis]